IVERCDRDDEIVRARTARGRLGEPGFGQDGKIRGGCHDQTGALDPGQLLELGGNSHELDRIAIAVAMDGPLDDLRHAATVQLCAGRLRADRPAARSSAASRPTSVSVPEVAPYAMTRRIGVSRPATSPRARASSRAWSRSENAPRAAGRREAALMAVVRAGACRPIASARPKRAGSPAASIPASSPTRYSSPAGVRPMPS